MTMSAPSSTSRQHFAQRLAHIGRIHLIGAAIAERWCGQKLILHRKHYFHALVKIARHPVGARQIHFLMAPIRKEVNPAVFEETASHTSHVDAIADATHPRAQSAHSADNQIDLHPILRSFIQSHNDVFVQQRVHLGDDVRRTPVTRVLRLPCNQSQTMLRQIEWRNHERAVIWMFGVGREKDSDLLLPLSRECAIPLNLRCTGDTRCLIRRECAVAVTG